MPDKSTPTPWKAVDLPHEKLVIHDAIGVVATISGRFIDGKRCDVANAALIVRAVNRDHLFGELVEALTGIAELQDDKCQTASAEMLYALLSIKVGAARTILAKVKEAGHG